MNNLYSTIIPVICILGYSLASGATWQLLKRADEDEMVVVLLGLLWPMGLSYWAIGWWIDRPKVPKAKVVERD